MINPDNLTTLDAFLKEEGIFDEVTEAAQKRVQKKMWQILVPTMRRADDKPIKTRYHRVWDEKVRAITGGLTILPPNRGQWIDPNDGNLFIERMIPVQFIATEDEKDEIMDMTAVYYDQLAVLCWEISQNVTMRFLDEAKKNIDKRKHG